MRPLLVSGLVLAVAASGCVGGVGESLGICDPHVDVDAFHPGAVGASVLERAENTSIPLVVWVHNEAPGALQATVHATGADVRALPSTDPASGPAETRHRIAENGTAFQAFSVQEPPDGRELSLEVETEAAEAETDLQDPLCDDRRSHVERFQAEVESDTSTVEEGEGVLVRTVGWWPNGSSFYTNMERYHERPDLPHDYLGPYNGSDPLKVYVYDESGDEKPKRYNESGYATTIEGFNEALKGMETAGGRVTYLEPSKAYTTEGNEDHALYGDPLIFYIEAVETRTVPCEVPQPICTPPEPGPRRPGALTVGPLALSR